MVGWGSAIRFGCSLSPGSGVNPMLRLRNRGRTVGLRHMQQHSKRSTNLFFFSRHFSCFARGASVAAEQWEINLADSFKTDMLLKCFDQESVIIFFPHSDFQPLQPR